MLSCLALQWTQIYKSRNAESVLFFCSPQCRNSVTKRELLCSTAPHHCVPPSVLTAPDSIAHTFLHPSPPSSHRQPPRLPITSQVNPRPMKGNDWPARPSR
ncbi:hypothetical protein E2C01_050588 [Portunus trituberculatus]|uniref:Uncharacterized protein n=1 Tax=Portunus trituberculatus TaxID=210409 RepID=A0A5B7GGX4_PORTR|nr:hypothetical protein [Portunus trituberculatus]